MNRIILFIISLALLGCNTVYGPENRAFGHLYEDPSQLNGYTGTIGNEPPYDIKLDELERRCISYGGLDSKSVVQLKTSWDVQNKYMYKCNYANNPPTTTLPVHRDDTQKDSDALRAKSDGGGGYAPSSEDKSNSSNQLPLPQVKDLSIAKKQCEELGFKPKTEKFGKCVLELSK